MAEQRPQVTTEGIGDVITAGTNELVGHAPGSGGDLPHFGEIVLRRVVAGTLDDHRATQIATAGIVNGFLAHLAGFTGVHIGNDTGKRTLKITERIGTHPLDSQFFLHHLDQRVGQRATRKLDVAVRIDWGFAAGPTHQIDRQGNFLAPLIPVCPHSF